MVNGTRRSYGRRWLDVARHPARRDGALLWTLLVLPWVVALVLVRRHHHLDVGGWTLVLTASVGLPTLWVTWAAFRDSRRSAAAGGGPGMAQVADELAAAVGKQWDQEAAVRRLNDPYPLPVSWAAADDDMTDAWDLLVQLADSGAGWPSPSPGQVWAAGPDCLAGAGDELAEVLERVPTGRLVVLGEPGAGKTMLMVRLVLDLLARRAAGGPVPVLAPVASWDPSGQDLRDWLSVRLMTDYPALAGPPPPGAAESTADRTSHPAASPAAHPHSRSSARSWSTGPASRRIVFSDGATYTPARLCSGQPSAFSTRCGRPAAHSPVAVNESHPASRAAIATAITHGRVNRTPRRSRGSGSCPSHCHNEPAAPAASGSDAST